MPTDIPDIANLMKRPLITAIALSATLAMPLASFGNLDFASDKIVRNAELTDESVEAVFTFTNTGKRTVKITEVKSSCGCTVADLEKYVYAPGESGTIKATFNIGSRMGTQYKTIAVKTDNPEQPTKTISLQVEIPVAVKIFPRLLFWRQGDGYQPKSFTVEAGHESVLGIRRFASMNSGTFSMDVDEIEEGKQWRVTVTPRETDAKERGTILIEPEYSLPDYQKNFFAYLRLN